MKSGNAAVFLLFIIVPETIQMMPGKLSYVSIRPDLL